MNFSDYLDTLAAELNKHPDWRYGQTAFNVLYTMAPELADEVRAGPLDPYYAADPERLTRFFAFVYSAMVERDPAQELA